MTTRSERPSQARSMAVHEQGIGALHELAQQVPEAQSDAGPELRSRLSASQLGEPDVRQECSQSRLRPRQQTTVAKTQIQPMVLARRELETWFVCDAGVSWSLSVYMQD